MRIWGMLFHEVCTHMPIRVIVLLVVVAMCLSAVMIYALSQGIDGTALMSFMGAMGLIFGSGLGFQLGKGKGPKTPARGG